MSRTANEARTNWREGRRLCVLELHEQGWAGKTIVEGLGVTEGTVSQWLKRPRDGGRAALRHRAPPGPAHRLTAAQREQLLARLAKGAESYGFIGEVWTTKRVATLIRQEFGVQYHPAHVSRVLRQIGSSAQNPPRDEAAIKQ